MSVRDLGQAFFFTLFIRPFVTLFIGLRVSGFEHLPRRDPFILVANHSSHLDTICLLSLFRILRLRRIRPVAAADYFERNAFTSLVSRVLFNILPIPRKDFTPENHPLKRMHAALQHGDSLIIFPEGTRGSGELGKFRSGVARLASETTGIPVIPAFLVNMGRSLPKGELIPVPFFCEVRLGAPVALSGDTSEMTAQIENAVRSLGD